MKHYNLDITVDESLLDREAADRFNSGSYTIMVDTPETSRILRNAYGRKGLALKVLKGMTEYRTMTKEKRKCRWGAVSLERASIIQNLFAREEISPRIYGLAFVNGIVAQVTEYVERTKDPSIDIREKRVNRLKGIMSKYGIVSLSKSLDIGVNNWRDNKFVDFSHLDFADYTAYLQELNIRARMRRGVLLSKAYQPVPGLNIPGTRDIKARIKNLNLNTVPFKDAIVLDVGCNLGAFSRYALDAGAKRIISIDKKGQVAFEINNVLGYWNMDIVTRDIVTYLESKKGINNFKFDIAFLMAVQNYIGGIEAALSVVAPVVKNLVIIESHGGEKRTDIEPILHKFFKKIEYLGYVEDPQIRHEWKCYK